VQHGDDLKLVGGHAKHDAQGMEDVRLAGLVPLAGVGLGGDRDGALEGAHDGGVSAERPLRATSRGSPFSISTPTRCTSVPSP